MSNTENNDFQLILETVMGNLNTITYIRTEAAMFINGHIRALYDTVDAVEGLESAGTTLDLKAFTRLNKVQDIKSEAAQVENEARFELALLNVGGINLESFNEDSEAMKTAVSLKESTNRVANELSRRWVEHQRHLKVRNVTR